ncbi:germ cell nuclear acidic protein [Scleropages formosus]|uniref:germ cell nuclear acidic protein n=1 Tax=Scleropages formosus TaxID=113540 RepID=UPI0010FA99CC|nr:acidic repeat-containing protein-like [Scleropages formosus]
MDHDASVLFQKVAHKLGWTREGGLESAEQELLRSIGKSRRPATGRSDAACSRVKSTKSELSDSDDSTKENWSPKGCKVLNLDSSDDDDFDLFLLEKTTPQIGVHRPRRPPKDNVACDSPQGQVESSDSDDFETFLSRVKTPKTKPVAPRGGRDDSLKDFIVDSSSDEDFVTDGRKKKSASRAVSKTPRSVQTPPTALEQPPAQSESPVFLSDEDEDVVITSTWKSRHPPRSSCFTGQVFKEQALTPRASSPVRSLPPSSAPSKMTYRTPLRLDDSSSEEEFLSLLDRLKQNSLSNRKNTETPKPKAEPKKKPSLSVPSGQGLRQDSGGAGHWRVDKGAQGVNTPVHPAQSKPESHTEPRAVVGGRTVVCKTPNCFLQSLSAPGSVYCRSFKQLKEELTGKLYQLYNRSVFDSKLPTDMSVTWNKKMRKTAGYCITGQDRSSGSRYARIELSEKVCDSADRLRDTLVHEMCHAATWLINGVRDGHGPFWKLYARKATLAHPELPMVTRCHSYDINYKYQYQCSCCKNIIGRHSKSLDTQRFVCALCAGKLVLLSSGKSRGPTPFASFVKEHYSSVRQELAGQGHAEVMRKLSADFAAKARLSCS